MLPRDPDRICQRLLAPLRRSTADAFAAIAGDGAPQEEREGQQFVSPSRAGSVEFTKERRESRATSPLEREALEDWMPPSAPRATSTGIRRDDAQQASVVSSSAGLTRRPAAESIPSRPALRLAVPRARVLEPWAHARRESETPPSYRVSAPSGVPEATHETPGVRSVERARAPESAKSLGPPGAPVENERWIEFASGPKSAPSLGSPAPTGHGRSVERARQVLGSLGGPNHTRSVECARPESAAGTPIGRERPLDTTRVNESEHVAPGGYDPPIEHMLAGQAGIARPSRGPAAERVESMSRMPLSTRVELDSGIPSRTRATVPLRSALARRLRAEVEASSPALIRRAVAASQPQAERTAPATTRVDAERSEVHTTFHVHLSGHERTLAPDEREVFRDTLLAILREEARRQGVEV